MCETSQAIHDTPPVAAGAALAAARAASMRTAHASHTASHLLAAHRRLAGSALQLLHMTTRWGAGTGLGAAAAAGASPVPLPSLHPRHHTHAHTRTRTHTHTSMGAAQQLSIKVGANCDAYASEDTRHGGKHGEHTHN